VVYHEFVPQGQTINDAFYVEVLKRLRERVRRVRSQLWAEKNWTCITIMHPRTRQLLWVSYHPSHLPSLAPCDFSLFPKVKTIMLGEHFGNVQNIKRETTRLPKNLTS
jgi:hypothetical protein